MGAYQISKALSYTHSLMAQGLCFLFVGGKEKKAEMSQNAFNVFLFLPGLFLTDSPDVIGVVGCICSEVVLGSIVEPSESYVRHVLLVAGVADSSVV